MKIARRIIEEIMDQDPINDPDQDPTGDVDPGAVFTDGKLRLIYVGSIARGSSTTFFVDADKPDSSMYYIGEDPGRTSDGMVMRDEWEGGIRITEPLRPTGETLPVPQWAENGPQWGEMGDEDEVYGDD